MQLYYTDISRISSKIIKEQSENVEQKKEKSIEAMHNLKKQASMMKEAILKGKLDNIGEVLDYGWENKKKMAKKITNSTIEKIYKEALQAGASGGKISGAGGGGFMILYCPGNTRFHVESKLKKYNGQFHRFQFTKEGLTSWTLRD